MIQIESHDAQQTLGYSCILLAEFENATVLQMQYSKKYHPTLE